MEWVKGKLGQIIALFALVSTIAGFGYAGAGYVTRLEAVEKKIWNFIYWSVKST